MNIPWALLRRFLTVIVAVAVTWLVTRSHYQEDDPPPRAGTALNKAAETITMEVSAYRHPQVAPEYLYAIATMNYVQSRLSPARRSAISRMNGVSLPRTTHECLTAEAGICGDHVQSFQDILTAANSPILRRAVEFYIHDEEHEQNESHVVIEVFWGERWHMFDITAGTFFRRAGGQLDDVLSVDELMELARSDQPWRALAVTNMTNPWFHGQLAAGHDPFKYVAWPRTDVLKDGRGVIHLRPAASGQEFSLVNMPESVGHVREYCGHPRQVEFMLDPQAMGTGKTVLEVEVGMVGGFNPTHSANLIIQDETLVLHIVPLSELAGRVVRADLAAARGHVTIRVESGDGEGRVAVRRVRLAANGNESGNR